MKSFQLFFSFLFAFVALGAASFTHAATEKAGEKKLSKAILEECRLAKDEMECLKKKQAEMNDEESKAKALAELKKKKEKVEAGKKPL